MRARICLVAAAAVLLAPGPAPAAEPAVGILEQLTSRFRVTGRSGGRYLVDVAVRRFDGSSTAVVTITKRCGASRCPQQVYVARLQQGELEITATGAVLVTRFGGRPFEVQWAFGDPDPEAGPAERPVAIRRYAVTANNALNVGCYGVGEARSVVVAAPGGLEEPEGRPFPQNLPDPFVVWRGVTGPSCTTDSPG